MKKTVSVVLVALICLIGSGLAVAAGPPVWIPGVLPDSEALIGARYENFGGADAQEVYVGVPPDFSASTPADLTWVQTNQITFTYEATGNGTLTTVINGYPQIQFTNVAGNIDGKEATLDDLNFLQITIANNDLGTTVNFNDVFLNGASLGSFGGNGTYNWSVRDDTLYEGFTITGTVRLLGTFGTDPDLSMLEIKAGYAPPNHPPVCDYAYASPASLWPPNHKFNKISVLGVTDPDGDPITITVNSIFQDEPVNGTGDGNTSPDGKGIGTSSAEVRAERSGSGNGRFYHIGFTADDGKGGTCTGAVTVNVPKSKGKKGAAIDDGALYDSTLP